MGDNARRSSADGDRTATATRGSAAVGGPQASSPKRGPASGEDSEAAHDGSSGRSARWLAPTAMTATTAGSMVAGVQGNTTIAAITATPTLVASLLFFFGVVCPAVWSRKPQRRTAAIKVLNTLIGRSSARPRASK